MKKLLLILIIVAGINCQAQNVDFKDVPEVKEIKQRISQLEAGRSVQFSVLRALFNQMLSRVDSLEGRLAWHEKMHIDDSLKAKRSTYTMNFWPAISDTTTLVDGDTIIPAEVFKSKYIKIEKTK